MIKRITILCLLSFFITHIALAQTLGIKKSSETIAFFLNEPILADGTQDKPDSVHIFTYADNASAATYTARSTTYPFSDISLDTLKINGDTTYVFADAIADIDGGGGNFVLAIIVRMFGGGVPTDTRETVQIIADSLAQFAVGEPPTNWNDMAITASTGEVQADVKEISTSADAANNLETFYDNVGAQWTNFDDFYDGTGYAGGTTRLITEADIIAISGDANAAESLEFGLDGGIPTYSEQLAKMAYFDTLIYMGAIWLDDGAANTNTVVGKDGHPQNPVSTLAAARTLADALNLRQYNIMDASSFTLDATYENWVFHDIGHNSTIDLGSRDVDNSTFEELIITGIQGGTGTISLLDCDIVDLHDFDGEALFCWLVDSLVMDNNSSAFFGNCYSEVAGNGTPKIDFHVASNNVAFRNYSGGINIFNMSSNDKLSIEGNGQIIVDATCSNAPIVARGNFTITDNGSGTVWTYDAVYNKGFVRDTIWVDGQDLDFDSLSVRTVTIINPSGSGTGLHIQGSNHGAYIRTTGAGTAAIYADGGGGAHTDGIKASSVGDGFDINATLNLDNLEGTLDAPEIGADAITAAKIATNAIGADEIADNAIDAGAIATDAIGASEIATNAISSSELATNAITNAQHSPHH